MVFGFDFAPNNKKTGNVHFSFDSQIPKLKSVFFG